MANGQVDKGKCILILILAVVVVVGTIGFVKNTGDPLQGRTPDIQAYLAEEKTLCENRVQQLKAKGIDGRGEYERVQMSANGCVAYLQGVLDQGWGDDKAIKVRFEQLRKESAAFCAWADTELHVFGAGERYVDLASLASSVLKLLDGQERARREAVKKGLEMCKFQSWDEIAAGQ